MKIKVTQQDIAKGSRKKCDNCPIARAIKRETKSPVWVNSNHVDYLVKNELVVHLLPKKAITFIKRFDAGETVKPFTFEIEKYKL